jgi:hypothetical protein
MPIGVLIPFNKSRTFFDQYRSSSSRKYLWYNLHCQDLRSFIVNLKNSDNKIKYVHRFHIKYTLIFRTKIFFTLSYLPRRYSV